MHPSQSGRPCVGLLDYHPAKFSQTYQSSTEHDAVHRPVQASHQSSVEHDELASAGHEDASDRSATDPEIPSRVDASGSEEDAFQLRRWGDLDDDDSSEESTHVHSGGEEVEDSETGSKSADAVSTIYEVRPAELGKFMTMGERRQVRSNVSELMSPPEQSTPAQPVAVPAAAAPATRLYSGS